MDSTFILDCQKISKKVIAAKDEITIFTGIDLQLTAGEAIAITGRSGSGKTTLIRILAGLDLPSVGDVYLFRQRLNRLTEDERARLRSRYIGIVFQSFHLLSSFSALENVMLPLEMHGKPNAKAQAAHLLERVGMADRMHHFPATLSGGEQQRVAIARAFVVKPSILLADEPTGNLDTATGICVAELLFELNQEYAVSLVLVTHDLELGKRCNRSLHLSTAGLM